MRATRCMCIFINLFQMKTKFGNVAKRVKGKKIKKNWFRILQQQQRGINATKRDDCEVCEAKLRALLERWAWKIIECFDYAVDNLKNLFYYQSRYSLEKIIKFIYFLRFFIWIWTWNKLFSSYFIFTIWLRTQI